MCTLSLVYPEDSAYRLCFNRDELHSRPAGLAPEPHRSGLWPLDPVSGGTWIGVNAHGLSLAILNVNLAGAPAVTPRRSRGAIIPELLPAAATAQAALQALSEVACADLAAFRLVAIDTQTVGTVWWDGHGLRRCWQTPHTGPVFFTSSSLGDHLVEPPRRALFGEVFADPAMDQRRQQDAFHRHCWPDRLPLSVMMSRPDACTVSRTTIECDTAGCELHYDSFRTPPTILRLARQ